MSRTTLSSRARRGLRRALALRFGSWAFGSLVCVALAARLAGGAPAAGAATADQAMRNLQVLPKQTSRDEVKRSMRAMSRALGVGCDACHDSGDYASDQVALKEVSRRMMRMTDELNRRWFSESGAPSAAAPSGPVRETVTCATCHRGRRVPAAD